MKYYLLTAVLFASHQMVFGQVTDKELKQFDSELEISGVRTETRKSDDRKKFEILEVNTFQSDDDPDNYDMSRFRMRLVVELTDKEKNTYLVQYTGNSPEDRDSEYEGEDYWTLSVAHGDMDGPKISGYLIQYGIMDGETFISLAEEERKSKEMLERVRERTTSIFQGKVYLRHYYIYDDSTSGGGTESNPVNIRRIKE